MTRSITVINLFYLAKDKQELEPRITAIVLENEDNVVDVTPILDPYLPSNTGALQAQINYFNREEKYSCCGIYRHGVPMYVPLASIYLPDKLIILVQLFNETPMRREKQRSFQQAREYVDNYRRLLKYYSKPVACHLIQLSSHTMDSYRGLLMRLTEQEIKSFLNSNSGVGAVRAHVAQKKKEMEMIIEDLSQL